MSNRLCKIYYGLEQVNKRRERALELETDYAGTVIESITFKKSFADIYDNSVYGLRPIRCLISNALARFPGEWENCTQRIQTCRLTSGRRKTTLRVRRAQRSRQSNRAEMFRRNCVRIDSISNSIEQLSRNFSSLMEERFDHWQTKYRYNSLKRLWSLVINSERPPFHKDFLVKRWFKTQTPTNLFILVWLSRV